MKRFTVVVASVIWFLFFLTVYVHAEVTEFFPIQVSGTFFFDTSGHNLVVVEKDDVFAAKVDPDTTSFGMHPNPPSWNLKSLAMFNGKDVQMEGEFYIRDINGEEEYILKWVDVYKIDKDHPSKRYYY